MKRWVLILVAALVCVAPAGAVTAVLETNHHEWYNAGSYGGLTMTQGYAPFAVFFEAWKSTPRADIVDWRWDFGDGSDIFHGFNAAHVYETPGTYTVTLTVEDKNGATDTATTSVTVMARNGTTYYVDAETGNDANNGLTPETAWRSGTHAFMGMTNQRYGPGDQILFKRGQTFTAEGGQVIINTNQSGFGYMFGAFGEGPKPKIQYVGSGNQTLINQPGDYMAHVTFMDLELHMRDPLAPDTNYAELFCDIRAKAHNLLFYRLDFKEHNKAISFTGHHDAQQISNVFIMDCTAQNGGWAMFYNKSSRMAAVGNHFDLAGNHVWYGAWTDVGVWSKNIFTRAAFGRTALRIAAASNDFAWPSHNVYVGENYLGGFVDPIIGSGGTSPHGDGIRHNYHIVYFAPNVGQPQFIHDVMFERNVVSNGEMAILIGDYEDLIIRNNLFTSVSPYTAAYRIQIGHVYDRRPTQNVFVEDNVFWSYQNRSGSAGIFGFKLYGGGEVNGVNNYRNFVVTGNEFYGQGGTDPVLYTEDTSPELINEITMDNNVYHRSGSTRFVQVGGAFNTLGTNGVMYDLAGWRTATGNDLNTVIQPESFAPFPGQAFSPTTSYSYAFDVAYEDAVDYNGGPIPTVKLWVREENGAWQDTGLTGPGPEGVFNYTAPGPGIYHFATSSVNSLGIDSFLPTDQPTSVGSARTIVFDETQGGGTEPPPPDVTAPDPGIASAPANASTVPITVTYSGASDPSPGSGLKQVNLWVRKDGGAWEDSGLPASLGGSGSFEYTVPGNGTYEFDLVATDHSNNTSALPSGSGDTTTVFALEINENDSLLTELRFDDPASDGIATDSSGNDNHGTMSGGAIPTLNANGQVGGAYTFDGNDMVSVGNLDVNNTGLTLAAFVRATGYSTSDNGGRIISKSTTPNEVDRTWQLQTWLTGGSTKLVFHVRNADGVISGKVASGGSIQLNQWHHVAATYDGSMMKIYLDGNIVGTKTFTGPVIQDPTKPVGIGNNPGGGYGWIGDIDEAAIYDYALTDAEIQILAAGGDVGGGGGGGDPEPPQDTTAPAPGNVVAPSFAKASPIALSYSGAGDESGGSGLASVTLWASKDGGPWASTGMTSTTPSGTFNYAGMSGDGTYAFALVAADNAGNNSATPTGGGNDSTVFDTSAPSPGTPTVGQYSTSPISVNYSGAADTAGSGFKRVMLWARQGAGSWANTGVTSTNASGTLVYNGASGDNTYYFALQAEDNAGNLSPAPSGNGQVSTMVDTAAPNVGSLTAASQFDSESPITLNYTGVSDAGSGIKEVVLWAKKGAGGAWAATALKNTAASGTFNYTGMSGDATYFFALRVEDNAGNKSVAPSGAGSASTTYDTSAPGTGTVTVPSQYTSTSPIEVSYSGVGDSSGSGLQEVRLWVRKDAGGWTDSGQTSTQASGAFTYFVSQGDGVYRFALQTTDDLGNSSPTPTGDGQANVTFDTSAPSVGTLTGPEDANEGPVTINYSGVSDNGSGLKQVKLWVRKPGNSWLDTGQTSTAASGSFSFTGFVNDGPYHFAVQAEDNAGNTSTSPSGTGQFTLTYDATAPTLPTLTAPASASSGPIEITYSGASDNGSGLAQVELWARKGAGAWAATGLTATTASGAFSYSGMSGDDTYYFAARATDNAGNASPEPSGDGQASTAFDTSAPAAPAITMAAFSAGVPVDIGYTGDPDIQQAYLWMRKGAGAWTDTGMVESGSSGSFHFNAFTDDDTYYWSVQVEDEAGNKSAAPSGDGQGNTIFDTTAPAAPAMSVDSPTGGTPITVNYTGASDGGSGVAQVELWVRKDSGAWSATGQTQPGQDGAFDFAGMSGDGAYHFAAQVTDEAGNSSAPPSGAGLANTVYDTTAPSPGVATAPASASTNPITVNYAGVSDTGSGVAQVELWVRQGAGAWQPTGQTSTAVSGSFSYNCPADDTFYFALRATDEVGNASPEPSGDGNSSTAFDSTPPSGATVTAPAYANAGPVTVSYVGSPDVARAHLWFRKATGGTWTDTGLTSEGSSGSFDFNGFTGDDTYYLDVRTEDDAQNLSPVPTNSGAASTVYDTTAPDTGSIAAPEFVNAGPISLNYTGVADSGSGVKVVRLWMRKGAGGWSDTGQTQSGAAGAFTFNGFTGDDTYYFALQAEDNAGNDAPTPAGDGLASVVFDTTAPTVGSLTAPETTATAPISLSYTGVSDNGTGLKEVRLWVRKGAGAWAQTSFTSPEAAGTFEYNGMTGDATYYFALQAEDEAGNMSAAPTGSGLDSTLYDATPPAPATLTLAQYDTTSPIVVAFNANTTDPSGFESVRLWARKGAGAWTDTGQTSTQPLASFSYSGVSGDDTYYFYVQVEDGAGNKSPDPTGNGSGQVIFDTTAPTVGGMTATQFANTTPLSVGFSGVSDSGSGLKEVVLWRRKDGGAWQATTVKSTAGSGTFSVNSLSGDGTYEFAMVAEDNAGNKSAAPTGTGLATTEYDATAPTPGAASVPPYVAQNPVTVQFTGSSDAGSGLEEVTLYVRKNSGAWTSTNLKSTEPSGSFEYTVTTGDGTYAFALRAKDEAGNESPVPSGQGDDSTVFDTTAPTAATLTAPAHASAGPITVNFTGANDAGSGIDEVELYVKKDGGAWNTTGDISAGSSGSFSFDGFTGEGTYYFATVVTDKAGKESPAPSGNGSASTVLDTTAPTVGSVSAPSSDNGPPISVTYSGVADTGSGVDEVQLWVKKGSGGAWTDSGERSVGGSGAISYSGMTGDDTYYFALRVDDKAGNISAAPSGDGQASTVYDTSFTPGTASSPEYATQSPITVTYEGAADNQGGAITVHLWYKFGEEGAWTDTGMTSTGSSGQFQFTGMTDDGGYFFALQAEKEDGTLSAEPFGNGDTTTLYDTVAPTPLTLDSEEATNVTPIVVNYEGVTDEGSGLKEVHLWVKRGIEGTWEDTGLFLTSDQGSFEYDTGGEENRYFFYVQAMDKAGLTSPPPTDEIVFGAQTD